MIFLYVAVLFSSFRVKGFGESKFRGVKEQSYRAGKKEVAVFGDVDRCTVVELAAS